MYYLNLMDHGYINSTLDFTDDGSSSFNGVLFSELVMASFNYYLDRI